MKILNGAELAGYIKERQRQDVARVRGVRGRVPRLVILRDSCDPVIEKYVGLKKRYGEDIGVEVRDEVVDGMARTEGESDTIDDVKGAIINTIDGIKAKIDYSNRDIKTDGIIVQLPLAGVVEIADYGERMRAMDAVVGAIAPEKDVDDLTNRGKYDGATVTAINWLLAGYDIELSQRKIAIVGYGKLVGKPLKRLWDYSDYDIKVYDKGDDLSDLRHRDLIVTATGVPRLIKSEMVAPGAVVVDAGAASEDGVIVGDVDEAVRERDDLEAITPVVGGVGPLTICALFENLLKAARG